MQLPACCIAGTSWLSQSATTKLVIYILVHDLTRLINTSTPSRPAHLAKVNVPYAFLIQQWTYVTGSISKNCCCDIDAYSTCIYHLRSDADTDAHTKNNKQGHKYKPLFHSNVYAACTNWVHCRCTLSECIGQLFIGIHIIIVLLFKGYC